MNYSLSRQNINNPRESFNLSARANMQITKNWKVSWNARLDIVTKEILYQNFNIYRDLHCWEMSFGWQPERGYYDFRINVKSSVLQDIKVTKHARDSRFIPR
jgi:lipopolysaccharide assembly outer membrane protein LptD (OstA)